MRVLIVAALIAAIFVSPAKADDETVRVRVTFYTLSGCMASSTYKFCNYTHKDAAACSKHYPFGTQLQFEDGYTVTCEDRGLGDYYWPEWVDVWAPSYEWGIRYIESDYGLYTRVNIIRWGWNATD